MCTGCQQKLPATAEYFHRSKKGCKLGLRAKCKSCIKIDSQIRYQKNKETINAKNKQYKEENREKYLESTRRYYQNNKDKYRNYYLVNRDTILEQHRSHYQQHADKILNRKRDYNKAYAKTLKGKASKRAAKAKRRVSQMESTQGLGMSNKNLIKKIYKYCPEGYQVDHIIPVSRGGDHHESNLCYLPSAINASKGARTIEEFGNKKFCDNVLYWQDLLSTGGVS